MSYNIKRRYIKSIFVVTHNNIFRNGPIGHHTSIKNDKIAISCYARQSAGYQTRFSLFWGVTLLLLIIIYAI